MNLYCLFKSDPYLHLQVLKPWYGLGDGYNTRSPPQHGLINTCVKNICSMEDGLPYLGISHAYSYSWVICLLLEENIGFASVDIVWRMTHIEIGYFSRILTRKAPVSGRHFVVIFSWDHCYRSNRKSVDRFVPQIIRNCHHS